MQRDDCGKREGTVQEWFKVLDDDLPAAQKRHGLVEIVVEAAKACCVLMLGRQMSEFREADDRI